MTRQNQARKTGFGASRREIDDFLALFTDVEMLLKKRLGAQATDREKVSRLIELYRKKNAYFESLAGELALLKDIRNVLVHAQSYDDGYPVMLRPRTVERLKSIRDYLHSPETVGQRFGGEVATVSTSDSLASILALAYERKFSQFPVLKDRHFLGVITENAIVRWLGRRSRGVNPTIDLAAVKVSQVIGNEEADVRQKILAWEPTMSPVDEVISLFSASPMLEVVLLSKDGHPSSHLEGIITQWDAARYASRRHRAPIKV